MVARYPVPGNGGFDYVTIDSRARRLYVSHGVEVNVVDADTGKLVGTIADTPGVHGAVVASEFKHGFTSNGREDKVSMFDPATLQLIKKIDVGKGPDGIYYNQASKRVFTNNHGSHDVTAIDAKTGDVVGTVKLEGDGEQAVIGADGIIYVNSENTSRGRRLRSEVSGGQEALPDRGGQDPHRAGLRRQNQSPVHRHTQRAENDRDGCRDRQGDRKLSHRYGSRLCRLRSLAKLVFFSCGEGILNIYHEKSADAYEDAGAVKTQPSAKTMAFDAKTGKIFLSAAEYEPAPAIESSNRPRRTVKPGSFVLLVVEKEK